MSFSMPPASRKALAFSIFLVMTSCRAQHIAVTVSSHMVLPAVLLAVPPVALLPPGRRWMRSRIAYLPGKKVYVRQRHKETTNEDLVINAGEILKGSHFTTIVQQLISNPGYNNAVVVTIPVCQTCFWRFLWRGCFSDSCVIHAFWANNWKYEKTLTLKEGV